jgi:hypothetical protein
MDKIPQQLQQEVIMIAQRAVKQELENGWSDWAKYVVENIKELSSAQKELLDHSQKVEIAVQVLKKEFQIKSGLYGLIGGGLTVLLGLGLWLVQRIFLHIK